MCSGFGGVNGDRVRAVPGDPQKARQLLCVVSEEFGRLLAFCLKFHLEAVAGKPHLDRHEAEFSRLQLKVKDPERTGGGFRRGDAVRTVTRQGCRLRPRQALDIVNDRPGNLLKGCRRQRRALRLRPACRRRPLHVRAVVACAGRNPIDALALVRRLRQRAVDRLGRRRLGRHCVTALLQTARSRRFERPGQHVIYHRTGLAWVNGFRIRGREIEPLHDGPEMSFLFLDIDRKPCSQSRVRQIDLLAALLQQKQIGRACTTNPIACHRLARRCSPARGCGAEALRAWQGRRRTPGNLSHRRSRCPSAHSKAAPAANRCHPAPRSPVARSASSPARVETSESGCFAVLLKIARQALEQGIEALRRGIAAALLSIRAWPKSHASMSVDKSRCSLRQNVESAHASSSLFLDQLVDAAESVTSLG